MKPFGVSLIAAGIYVFYCYAASAQEPASAQQQSRACQEADLVGTYTLVDFKETPPSKEDHHHKRFPYEYFAFYPQFKYASIAMPKAMHAPKELTPFLQPTTDISQDKHYRLSKSGMLDLYTGRTVNYSFSCIAALVTGDGYQKGDLILTGYEIKTGNAHKTVLYKLYRRWY